MGGRARRFVHEDQSVELWLELRAIHMHMLGIEQYLRTQVLRSVRRERQPRNTGQSAWTSSGRAHAPCATPAMRVRPRQRRPPSRGLPECDVSPGGWALRKRVTRHDPTSSESAGGAPGCSQAEAVL